MRTYGGKTSHVLVRRMRCPHCGKLHTVLPSILTRFKHYTTTVIEDVLDEVVNETSPEVQDGPSYLTMRLWMKWFEMNLLRIEGYLHSVLSRYANRDIDGSLLLENKRKLGSGWLGSISRTIYNSGGFLPPYHAIRTH